MFGVDKATQQIWHCDPLVITDEEGNVVFADRATVEFVPNPGNVAQGRARVTDAEPGPPLEIEVSLRLDRGDRIPDVRLGIRGGFMLAGLDADGKPVTWHTNGVADNFVLSRAHEEGRAQHWDSLVIRHLDTDTVLFTGAADIVRTEAASPDNLEALRVVSSDPAVPGFAIEVSTKRLLWPILTNRHFGELCEGADDQGQPVEWALRGRHDKD